MRGESGSRGWVGFLFIFLNILGTELGYHIFEREKVELKGDR
jgi:hypothetical protein